MQRAQQLVQAGEVEHVAPAEALYDIGCTARLQAVRPQSDGGFRIVTVGGDRFRLLDVVVGEDPPYLQAEVEWLDDQEPAEVPDTMEVLARSVRQQFTRYVSEVAGLSFGRGEEGQGSGRGDAVDAETAVLVGAVADDPRALSYLVASVALLTTEDRQALLAEPATLRRLAAESRLLRREFTLLQPLGAVPASLHEFAGPMTVN